MINKKLGLAAFMTLAFSLGNHAVAATGNGNSSATIVAAIAILPVQALAFGKIAAGSSSGTVVISTTGARSSAGGVTLITSGSTQTQGTFTVSGTPTATYTIDLPNDGVVTLSDGSSNTLAVDSFVSDPAEGANGLLSAGGLQTINVGATLSVSASQVPGTYTGTYPVVVEYN